MNGAELSTKRAILIAGPTASGKSALAISLAEDLGGVVINADSMQVYADLRILTARPSDDHQRRVPHRLFGHVDAAEAYSVGRWLTDLEEALAAAWALGQVPVLVGGTGLYFKALTQGLSDIPLVPNDIRSRLRSEALASTTSDLHARLALCDPAMAQRLRPTDPQRIIRALEIFEATGRSLLDFQSTRSAPVLPIEQAAAVFVAPPRPDLNRRIDQRFHAMIDAGACAEVERLASRRLDPALPAMRALGMRSLVGALNGDITLHDAVEQAKRSTRHYAKRQMTFARHQLRDFGWLPPGDGRDTIIRLWQMMGSTAKRNDPRSQIQAVLPVHTVT